MKRELRWRDTFRLATRWIAAPRRAAAVATLIAACALAFVRCTTPRAAAAMPEVQVLLDRDLATVELACDGSYQVTDGNGDPVAQGRRLASGRVRPSGDGLDLNGVALATPEMRLEPTDGDLFRYKGKSFAGDVRVRRDGRGRLEVSNVLDIEEYVAGVLFSEMPSNFPDDALKAQAVAARTYARWRLDHGETLLRSTDADQVYGGAGPKHARARALVAATRGQVLEADGRPLCSFFMSTCGGATVDGPEVFKDAPRAGLIGVECEWCKASPKYRWKRTLSLAELERRLKVTGLAAIDVERDRFGHALRFTVRSSAGKNRLESQEFRRQWNAGAKDDGDKLPSAWALRLDVGRAGVTFEGAGFGHGVGLCQFGAAGLGATGKSWREIVTYYYRGAQLVRRW